MLHNSLILIIDFGSQTTHLIARRIRDLGVETQIINPHPALKVAKKLQPSGLILSGGPSSVYQSDAPTLDPQILQLNIPTLGICYGWQLTTHLSGGQVQPGHHEYGPVTLQIRSPSPLFHHLPDTFQVFQSHGDTVFHPPPGFKNLATTPNIRFAAASNTKRKIFGLQFHPEVQHTQHGTQILKNFLERVCNLPTTTRQIKVQPLIDQVRKTIDQHHPQSRAITAVSGGVDSTVASAIVARAIDQRLTPVYCHNGLMRSGTKKRVQYIFQQLLNLQPIILDCQQEFLNALKGITNPEQKRTLIGNLYINKFEQVAKKLKAQFLVQGTIYSDVIESQGTRHAAKIKSHHNVAGLPKKMQLTLLEPLRNYYKDQVKQLGKQLGLPNSLLTQQPFPGPGQAIRIIGEVTKKRLAKQQKIDRIVLQVLKETSWYDQVFQSFPVLTGIKSTAIKGDGRAYGEVVALRIYQSSDIMTAGWAQLPPSILQQLSTRIINEVPGISRVVYDITTKPPATMEWE